LGLSIPTSEKFSLRLKTQLLSPVEWLGYGFYFGTGGNGASVTTGSTIYQFNLYRSLNFILKQEYNYLTFMKSKYFFS
jgi:hypothetical protein